MTPRPDAGPAARGFRAPPHHPTPDVLGAPLPEGADPAAIVAALAHELKTPTAVVLGLAERLRDGRSLLPPDRRAVERILVHARLAHTYVQAMEGATRLAHAEGSAPPPPADVARAVRYTVQDFAFVAERSGLHLYVDAPEHLRARIEPAHVGIVVGNLLVNAIRSTPDGGTVRCGLRATEDGVRIEVADSGPGIPPEDRARVLAPYVRDARGGDAVGGAGLGLGLAIVLGVARVYGGTVRIEDAPEGGASVVATFRPVGDGGDPDGLPVAPPPAVRTVREPVRPGTADAPLVAVVCDDPVRARLRGDELRRDGVREVVLHDPAWGAPTALGPDVVLLDMERSDVAELVGAIRGDPRHDDLPLVALVPAERHELRVELLRLGADEVCVAPQSGRELRARVDRLVA
ncbi:ATP-binding protein, partial [Patulibacter sp. S7RM1-6]